MIKFVIYFMEIFPPNLDPDLPRRYSIALLDGAKTVSTSYVLLTVNELGTFPGA